MAAKPPVGWVRISSSDPPLSVLARLSPDRPNVDQGYGGWTEVPRPRRAPLTTFTAAPGLHLSLPILLDGWPEASIEHAIAQLEQMGQPSASDGEPPQLRIAATGGAIPHQEAVWVIDTISYGDALMNGAGNRVRQQLTLALLRYGEDAYLARLSAANRRRAKAKAAKKKHGAATKRVVAARGKAKPKAAPHSLAAAPEFGSGEDLLSLAARELGDADRWVEIAQLNGIRDPRSISVGQVLRLP